MRLRRVILEAFYQHVFVGTVGGAVPLVEQATRLGAGGIGKFGGLIAERLNILWTDFELHVDQNHAAKYSGVVATHQTRLTTPRLPPHLSLQLLPQLHPFHFQGFYLLANTG